MASPYRSKFSRTQRGGTMIEQIMVLSIVAVLVAMAAPPLHKLLSSDQLRVAQTSFIAALRHARGTAVTSERRTLFCPSTDGTQCSQSTRWDRGWLLGHDSNNDHQPDGTPLRIGQHYPAKLVVRSSAGRSYVRFAPDGSAGGSNITLILCETGRQAALSVVVSNSGRIRGGQASATQASRCLQES